MATATESDRSPAFELAKLLTKPAFRKLLGQLVPHAERTVLAVDDDEPASQVFERIFRDTKPPVVLAIRRAKASRFGFCFMLLDAGMPPQPTAVPAERVDVHRTSTIGMLYDTLTAGYHGRRSVKVPDEWSERSVSVELADIC